MSDWDIEDRTVSYSCEAFDIVTETLRIDEETHTDFDYLSEPPSVVILPFTPAGDLVVIDEWRQAVKARRRGLPAGTLENGEEPADGVHRELLEETGYEPGSISKLTTMEPANGFSDALFHYFVAEDCTRAGEQSLDTDESISVTRSSLEEMLSMIKTDRICDGRSAFGVMYYHLFGPEGSPDT